MPDATRTGIFGVLSSLSRSACIAATFACCSLSACRRFSLSSISAAVGCLGEGFPGKLVQLGMVTETSLVAQLPSPVAVAALHSAPPMDRRVAMLEAFAVGLVVDLADLDLVDHDRDPGHAHVDAWWLNRESWLCRGNLWNLCRVGRVDRYDLTLVHRSSCYGRRDCESGCVQSHG